MCGGGGAGEPEEVLAGQGPGQTWGKDGMINWNR